MQQKYIDIVSIRDYSVPIRNKKLLLDTEGEFMDKEKRESARQITNVI